jgi:NAD(P)-dependent dehydrogenase (short-subunit alcohol dehydrogenase family)
MVPVPGMAAYNATKAGIVSLSQALAAELEGTAIGVSVACPGFMGARIFDSVRNRPKRLSLCQIERVKAFGEPAGHFVRIHASTNKGREMVPNLRGPLSDWSEHFACFIPPAHVICSAARRPFGFSSNSEKRCPISKIKRRQKDPGRG